MMELTEEHALRIGELIGRGVFSEITYHKAEPRNDGHGAWWAEVELRVGPRLWDSERLRGFVSLTIDRMRPDPEDLVIHLTIQVGDMSAVSGSFTGEAATKFWERASKWLPAANVLIQRNVVVERVLEQLENLDKAAG